MQKSDEDGCGGDDNERKTKAEVGGQFKCGLEGEGTVGGGNAKPGCAETTGQIQRPHIEMGKDGVEKEEET